MPKQAFTFPPGRDDDEKRGPGSRHYGEALRSSNLWGGQSSVAQLDAR